MIIVEVGIDVDFKEAIVFVILVYWCFLEIFCNLLEVIGVKF